MGLEDGVRGIGSGRSVGNGSGTRSGVIALTGIGNIKIAPYVIGEKWFYNGLIYTAISTTEHDDGAEPEYGISYLCNGTYYTWNGYNLVGADESNLMHLSGTETVTGNKTFSGSVALGDNATAQTKPISDISDAVATTKFVKDFAQDGEWQKPADWIDIRSGALDNSIYFLVAHSKPVENEGVYSIANYKKFAVLAQVSTSANTYDVFVDGIKVATTAHNTKTEIDWESLYNNGTLISGYDVIHPSELTTHVVRITPSVDTDTLIKLKTETISGQIQQGVLWCHFNIQNAIMISQLLGAESNVRHLLCEALTAIDDKITIITTSSSGSGLYQAFSSAASLIKMPVFEFENTQYSGSFYLAFRDVPCKKITIKKNPILSFQCMHDFLGKELDIENPILFSTGLGTLNDGSGANNLLELPKIAKEKSSEILIARADNLKPFFIDENFNDARKVLRIYGTNAHRNALKGLTVSPEAPFDGAEPQINVSYTGMDRAALVNLFKSLPTHVKYTIYGTLTENNGIFSGFSNDNYISVSRGSMTSWEGLEIVVSSPTGFVSNSGTQTIFAKRDDIYLYITAEGYLQYYDGSNRNIYQGGSGPAKKVKLKFTDSQVLCYYSLDGTEFILGVTVNALPSSFRTYSPFAFGARSYGSAYGGEIDMPNSYIKRNDLPYFVGDGINRSINVVGATGTPDLTAGDKAIVENKGWSLILS